MQTEASLNSEILIVLDKYEELIGTYAARARRMIERYGNVEALKRLVTSPDLQYGFEKLRDKEILDEFSFEALVVKYANLFSKDVVASAQWRLSHPYNLL